MKLATELGFIQSDPTPITEDNTGTLTLIEHGHFKDRSNHVHLHWCFVCDYIATGVLRLVQTPSRDQLADIGSKACSAPQFKFQSSLPDKSTQGQKKHSFEDNLDFTYIIPLFQF